MELLFESRSTIKDVRGKVYPVVGTARLDPDPVLGGRNPEYSIADAGGASIYGSVLYDSGRYRMWYQAWPGDWSGRDGSYVGYAESDDGVCWRKPRIGTVDYHGTDNNLVNLSFHSPSVFIDPHAEPSHRYRATGCGRPGHSAHPIDQPGYYAAHSPDGIHWELDQSTPVWDSVDVITSIYHPDRDCALVALKRAVRVAGVPRRSVFGAKLIDGTYTEDRGILIPDDYDDVAARARGYASADYYGLGMMPAGQGTVGFLWQFRHTLPRTLGTEAGVFGDVDVGLVYQERPGDAWLHAPGRRNFLPHQGGGGSEPHWAAHCIYTAANSLTVGDEQWLYVTGGSFSHAWYLDAEWKLQNQRREALLAEGIYSIGRARWTKDRLFGFRSDPEGRIDLELPEEAAGSVLMLNYETARTGSIRVEVLGVDGCGRNDSPVLTGSSVGAPVHLGATGRIPNGGDRSGCRSGPIRIRLYLDEATVWAYSIDSADSLG